MDQSMIDLFDRFTHGHINRRDFFDRLTAIGNRAPRRQRLTKRLRPNYARAPIVAENDERLALDRVRFDTAQAR